MNNRRPYLILAAAAVAAISLAVFFAVRGRGAPVRFSSEFFDTFDTHVTFTAFAPDEETFERYAGLVHDEMLRLHRLFDIYNSYEGAPNLRTLNDLAGKSSIKADPAIIDLLDLAKTAYYESGGTVNVALGPVLSIWHDLRTAALGGVSGAGETSEKSETNISIPAYQDLAAAAVNVSVDDIEIDRAASTVFLRHEGMRLDVGALAKGYAVQKTADLLRSEGAESALINAGGNVVAVGPPLDGRDSWNIGVSTPAGGGESGVIDVLRVPKGAVVTSGNYQRYFTHGGRNYHHIIDPATLFPAEGVSSVTILHPDSAAADMLSTAAFILPFEAARALVKSKGADAMWVMADGGIIMTEGYRKLSKLAAESSLDLK